MGEEREEREKNPTPPLRERKLIIFCLLEIIHELKKNWRASQNRNDNELLANEGPFGIMVVIIGQCQDKTLNIDLHWYAWTKI